MRGRALKVPALLLAALAVALSFESVRYGCLGIMRSEAFYRGRPTSYWSVVLRRQWEAEQEFTPFEPVWVDSLQRAVDALALHPAPRQVVFVGPSGSMPDPEELAEGWGKAAPEPNTRIRAFGTLPGAVPVLVALLADGRASVRADAAQALGRIGPPASEAVPALAEVLRNDAPFCRWHAAWALGQIGEAARPAVPPLKAMATRCKDAEATADRRDLLSYLTPQHAADLAAVAAAEAIRKIDPKAAREAGVPDSW